MIIYPCDHPATESENLFIYAIIIESYHSYHFRSILVSMEHLVPLIIKKEVGCILFWQKSGCFNLQQTK